MTPKMQRWISIRSWIIIFFLNCLFNPVGRVQQLKPILAREICFQGRKELGFFQLLSVALHSSQCWFFSSWQNADYLPALEDFGYFNYPVVCVWGRERENPECRTDITLHCQVQHWSPNCSEGLLSYSWVHTCTFPSLCLSPVVSLMLWCRNIACVWVSSSQFFISLGAELAIFLSKSQHKKHPLRAVSTCQKDFNPHLGWHNMAGRQQNLPWGCSLVWCCVSTV